MLVLDGIRLTQGEFTLSADMSVDEASQIAVIGPSGGGKTTLLNLIAGFEAPDHGTITWRGTDLTGLPPEARPVSMIFQEHNLFPHLTVAQNVGLGIAPSLRLIPGEQKRVEMALVDTGLAGMGDRKPGALSGGQRGRVALARVLVMNRPLLLLDEPFAALGPALRAEMLRLVATMSRDKGLTVLMVTHNPDDARDFADAVVFVEGGSVAAPVETEQLFSAPPKALADYLGGPKRP